MIGIEQGCQGLLEKTPHHAKRRFGSKCRNGASTRVDGQWLCLQCLRKLERKKLRRAALMAVVEAKWPIKSDPRMVELVDELLPFVKRLPTLKK